MGLKVFPNDLEEEVQSSTAKFAGDGVVLNGYDEDEVGGTAKKDTMKLSDGALTLQVKEE